MQEKTRGLAAILTANLIFGINIPVTKSLVTHWMTPMGYTLTRMVFGCIIFWAIGSFLPRERVDPRDLLVMMIGGLMGFLGTQFLFSQSLHYTTPVIFSLLLALTPVVVLLLSALFLKEIIPGRKIIGILISISGASMIILLSGSQESTGRNHLLGIFFALLTALFYAGYLVITRKISIKYHPVTIAKWMFLVSALVAIPFSLRAIPTQRIYSGEATLQAYGLLAFALLFSTTIAFFLMPVGLKRLEASTVSIFMNLQPVVASVVAVLAGQDVLTWDKPLATLLVIAGVYLVTTQSRKIKNRNLYPTRDFKR